MHTERQTSPISRSDPCATCGRSRLLNMELRYCFSVSSKKNRQISEQTISQLKKSNAVIKQEALLPQRDHATL